MQLVGVRGVSKVFANGVEALADVSLDVEAGEFLSGSRADDDLIFSRFEEPAGDKFEVLAHF